tara:strand:- start:100 stop:1386 length:1287 start_codon:yes stop_codon:yes gene_type:complete
MPRKNTEAVEQHRAEIAAAAEAWDAEARAADAWEAAADSESEPEWEEVASHSPDAPMEMEAAPIEMKAAPIEMEAAKPAPAPASNCIIDTVAGLRAAIGNMGSGQQRALRDEIGEIAVVTRAQENEDKKAAKAADAEAKKAARASASTAKKAAKAEKQRLRLCAAQQREAHNLHGKALRTVAETAASIKRVVGNVHRMSFEEIGDQLGDDDSGLAKALQYVIDNAELIADMVTYVRPETGESPKWATDASVKYRFILRALAVFHERSEEPLATAVHREKALNITEYNAWHVLGLGVEDESDSDDEAELESDSDDDDNEPITNLARKRPAQSLASGSGSSGGSAAEIGHNDEESLSDWDDKDDGKRRCVESGEHGLAAMLPPVPADPLLPADFAAIAASNADGQRDFVPAFTPVPGFGSGDEADMPDLP